MKRLVAILLAAVLVFALAACNDSSEEKENGKTSGSGTAQTDTTAQRAYDEIAKAEALCKEGMQIISIAWQFGINEAPDCTASTIFEHLAVRMGYQTAFVEEVCAYSAETLIRGDGNLAGWEFCLMTAEDCLEADGTYEAVDTALTAARNDIRKLSDDDTHLAALKNYYTQVSAYAAYMDDVTGSYNDMQDAVASYEGKIQQAKEPLMFDFD